MRWVRGPMRAVGSVVGTVADAVEALVGEGDPGPDDRRRRRRGGDGDAGDPDSGDSGGGDSGGGDSGGGGGD